MGSVAVVAYGRMNPVTRGHRYLAQRLKDEAQRRGGDAILYLSHSYDGVGSGLRKATPTNPLSYESKASYVRDALGDLVQVRQSDHKSIFPILTDLNHEGYTELVILGDAAFTGKPFEAYNGKSYHFNSIEKIVAGKRDSASADFIEAISATKARAAVAQGDFEAFATMASTRTKTFQMWLELQRELNVNDASA